MAAPPPSLPPPESHCLAQKSLVIAGAGIASLAFILALDLAWPPATPRPRITVCERGPCHPDPRREGYSISIRSDRHSGGLQALKRLGVLDDVLGASITGANGGRGRFGVWDAGFGRVMQVRQPHVPPDGLPVNAMRVARYVVRRELVRALPEWVDVRWGVGCAGAKVRQDGGVAVELENGEIVHCNVLIAADGANSMIRAALRPEDRLSFAGAVSIAATARMPLGLPAVIREDFGVAVGGDGHSLFFSPIDEHGAVWSISYLAAEPRTPVHGEEAVARADEVLKEARGRGWAFSEPFKSLIEATDPQTLMVFNAMDKQPVDHSSRPGSNVIFIGDANHAVSPFAGNGANMALMDGIDLADELVRAPDLASALRGFDAKSGPRSKAAIQQSHFAIAVGHSQGWTWLFWSLVLRVANLFFA